MQIVEVYGESAIKKGNVRKWFRLFKGSRTDVHEVDKRVRANISRGKHMSILHTTPKLAPSDYYCFFNFKKLLAGQSLMPKTLSWTGCKAWRRHFSKKAHKTVATI